jgi:polar amino acid transport system substrate-binding protein
MFRLSRFLLWGIFTFLLLHSCGKNDTPTEAVSPHEVLTSLDDIQGKRVAVYEGTVHDQFVAKKYPSAKIYRYDSMADMVLSLKTGKVDAACMDLVLAQLLVKNNPILGILADDVLDLPLGVGFNKKNTELSDKFAAFLERAKADGRYQKWEERWFVNDPELAVMPKFEQPDDGPLLRVGVDVADLPYVAYMNNEYVGFDIEMVQNFALDEGYRLEISIINYASLVAALSSRKVDLITDGMAITEERKQKVDFVQYATLRTGVLALKSRLPQFSRFHHADDLNGKAVGVVEGTIFDGFLIHNYPDADIRRYTSSSDMILSLKSGKLDAIFMDLVSAQVMLKSNPQLAILNKDLLNLPLGMGFNKNNPELRQRFNAFLKMIRDNGEYDVIYRRWFENDPEKAVMPVFSFPENAPILRAGVDVADLPYVAYMNNDYVGFDIELVKLFAQREGFRPIITTMNFSSLISALASGKVDLITDGMAITPERQKEVDFSDPHAELRTAVIVTKANLPKIKPLHTMDDLAGERIAVLDGSVYDEYARNNLTDSKIHTYNTIPDMLLALNKNRVDGIMVDEITGAYYLNQNPDLAVLADNFMDQKLGVGFSKENPALQREFNQFLKEIRGNGVYDDMVRRWFGDSPESVSMPKIDLPSEGPLLRQGIDIVDLPYVSFQNGEYVGFDIELLRRFAQSRGYRIELFNSSFGSLIAALVGGKIDVISVGMAITEERLQKINFSDPYASFATVMLVKEARLPKASEGVTIPEDLTFFQSLARSFHNNIIHEKRYLLIIDGLKVTANISLWSVLVGTIMGGLIAFMRMSKRALLRIPSQIFISILRGTPILVILMITFYVIFASVNIDPTLVSIIAFGLNFAAYVSEMYRTGIEGVDKGQTEAGIAMGFTKVQTFLFIVAPQAIRRILPVYKGEVISLVKMTSIVGYIAVQDLTRAGDIIRSRTFDAFFPLVMVAVLYFLISWLLLVALTGVEKAVEPKRKTQRS